MGNWDWRLLIFPAIVVLWFFAGAAIQWGTGWPF